MFHSIKIGTNLLAIERWVDTWADWGLIPSAKPTVSMAPANIKWQEIPGRSEPIDMTELVTNRVTYKNRTGSWSFIFVDDNVTLIPGATRVLHLKDDPKYKEPNSWDRTPDYRSTESTLFQRDIQVRYREIANFLHGKRYKCILEDEPDYYYEGRFQVGNLGSSNHSSTLTISYDLFATKKHVLSNTEWSSSGPWDLVMFENNRIPAVSGDKWKDYKNQNNPEIL